MSCSATTGSRKTILTTLFPTTNADVYLTASLPPPFKKYFSTVSDRLHVLLRVGERMEANASPAKKASAKLLILQKIYQVKGKNGYL